METVTRSCLWCQSDLAGAHPNRRYCSQSCKDRYSWRKRNPCSSERVCGWCGTDMTGKRSHAVYCSRTCKNKSAHVRLRKGSPSEAARNKVRYAFEGERRRRYARWQYAENREEQILYSREWRKANPERRKVQSENRRARKYGNPGYVTVTGRDWERIRNRFGGRCAYCGVRPDLLCMDHVVPLSRGGRHAPSNIVPACSPCNNTKAARFLSEWRLRL